MFYAAAYACALMLGIISELLCSFVIIGTIEAVNF